ncbi:hypothetical protein [Sphingomicrobium aestuariivivum]|uniref:hypothetical protein n=1 Tax=Sphingomicrobium aestuariivivum TaxID=1582356 RepID=UPI001FD6AED2|nr:hypothetical protein [Sphingomicrobium aestuariivivum]MCJ8189924.1 hypothetical protein [Sphingomicrobium aestuariivivum]
MENVIVVDVQTTETKIMFTCSGDRAGELFRGPATIEYSFDIGDVPAQDVVFCLLAPLAVTVFGEERVRLEFNRPVTRAAIGYFTLFHLLDTVYVAEDSISDEENWTFSKNNGEVVAHLYGGGKDSLAAYGMLDEIYPDAEHHLLRLHWSPYGAEKHQKAFDEGALKFLPEKFAKNYFWARSDLHKQLRTWDNCNCWHMALYFAIFLPYVLKFAPRTMNFAYDALEYYDPVRDPAKPFRFRRGHPVTTELFEQYYRTLGADTRITDISFGITPNAHFRIVARRYPELFNAMYMCEGTDERWCGFCQKCFQFIIYCLANSIRPEGFPTEILFKEGNRGAKVAELLESGETNKLLPTICAPIHFEAVRSMLQNLDLELAKECFPDHWQVFEKLRDAVAGNYEPRYLGVWKRALDYALPPLLARGVGTICMEAGVDVFDRVDIERQVGNERWVYDWK